MMASGRARSRTVALVDTQLRGMIARGAFDLMGAESLDGFVQPASVDIPIGSSCLVLKEKVLPFRHKVRSLLRDADLVLEERSVDVSGSMLLLKGQTYLFPCGTVRLAEGQHGSLSPKSSIGRVDLMVRGIFDECGLYDTISGHGELWLEVSPRSFNVRVRHGQALSQMMVFETRKLDAHEEVAPGPLEMAQDPATDMHVAFDERGTPLPLHVHRGSLVLSLNLSPEAPQAEGEGVLVGYEALPTNAVVDLGAIGEHAARKFFRPVRRERGGNSITLEKDRFYILSTKERVRIPLELSAEMVPFSSHVGELRAHYAGFFDPGFGYGRSGELKGTVGVLEVRPHETITVYDGQPICLMEFFHNADIPAKPYGQAGNNYQGQTGPKLAKYFC